MEQKQSHAFDFAIAMCRHWAWWIGSTVISAVLAVYQGGGHMIPTWALWTWALSGVIVAAFLAWRDERRKVEELQSRIAGSQTHPSLRNELNSRIEAGEILIARLSGTDGVAFIPQAKEWIRKILEFEIGHRKTLSEQAAALFTITTTGNDRLMEAINRHNDFEGEIQWLTTAIIKRCELMRSMRP